ncbi:MAG: SDR family NAD(P)-dependent oxidoreductase [Lachnospiraceae bacterium]|nr:SDR family NAD(P)-dependent oxidoreductase [Lachnospiraceae bacterium]MBR1851651.1 SDR family NAD(P)-dependent oxidoreductase [Lachnospiraceae bacterium]
MITRKIKGLLRSVTGLFKEQKIQPIPTQVNTTELLKGKVALITGGSGGIGSAIAESFLKNGCSVIIAGTSEDKLEKVKNRIGGVLLSSQ